MFTVGPPLYPNPSEPIKKWALNASRYRDLRSQLPTVVEPFTSLPLFPIPTSNYLPNARCECAFWGREWRNETSLGRHKTTQSGRLDLRTSALLEDMQFVQNLPNNHNRPICAKCIQSSSTYPHHINPPPQRLPHMSI